MAQVGMRKVARGISLSLTLTETETERDHTSQMTRDQSLKGKDLLKCGLRILIGQMKIASTVTGDLLHSTRGDLARASITIISLGVIKVIGVSSRDPTSLTQGKMTIISRVVTKDLCTVHLREKVKTMALMRISLEEVARATSASTITRTTEDKADRPTIGNGKN